MLTDGLRLIEGSVLKNPVVDRGTAFPTNPDPGELFFRTDTDAMFVHNGSDWVQVGLTSSQLEGQPGSYYLDNTNATGIMSIPHGGTGASSASVARDNLGLTIGVNVQAFDQDLSAIAALSGTSGLLKKTAANTWSLDPASYQPLDNDLTTIAALSGTGLLRRTGVDTWTLDSGVYLPTSGGTITGDVTIAGNITMTGNIIPSANNTYSLGSPTMTWKDVYVGPGSLYVNGKEVISDQSNTMVFSTTINQNLRIETTGTGNLELQPASTGTVLVKGAMTITSGKRILDSAGIQVEFGDNIEMSSNRITNLGAPTVGTDAANKTYVDTFASNAANLTSGYVPDVRISQTSVTQHQAALSIAETQITNGTLLARVADNETVTGTWTFNNAVTVGTPTSGSHAVTKTYVDSIAAGVTPQLAVRAATTANITLGGLQTIDGVSLVANDRVLVKDQTTGALNGVYVVAAGAWTRATDFDGSPTNEVATGDLVFVSEGTSNANTSFVLVTAGTITVGTTAMVFSVFSRAGDILAGTGLTRTGQTIDVIGTAGRIVANTDSIDLATVGTAGTYRSVTTDSYGRVTAGTNPTTLSGYGISDAQPLNTNLTGLAGVSTTGVEVRTGSGTYTTRSIAASGTGISITNADGVSGNPTVVSNATSANTASTIVARDASGNFTAGTITGQLSGNATTATTLQNARTINSVSFDGSANIAINLNNNITFNNSGTGAASGTAFSGSAAVTVSANTIGAPLSNGTYANGTWGISITGNAATATSSSTANATNYLGVFDGTSIGPTSTLTSAGARGTDLTPNSFTRGVFAEFKNSSLFGFAGNYTGLITFAPWLGTTASTGDPSYSLAFTPAAANSTAAPTLRLRAGIDTTWGSWATVLHSANYNSYAPTLTGTGASGTWGINITGNADTVDTYHASISQAANTMPVRDGSGYTFLYYINSSTPNSENATAAQVITTTGSDNYYRKNSIANFTSQLSGTAPINITGSAGSVGGYTMNQNLNTSNSVSFDIVYSTNNGNGTNFKVGDDAWIGDINASNTINIKGNQDGSVGYIRFGSNTNALGATSSGALTWGGVPLVTTAYTSDMMVNRGGANVNTNYDALTSSGYYTGNRTGDSCGVLVFAPGGSLGTAQIRMEYTGGMYFRNKTDNANWNGWKTVLTDSNYNSYSPTLTGGGASGTWNIRADGATKLWSTSHPNDFYVTNAWDGAYWNFTSNHGAGIRVARADVASNADSITNAVGGTYYWSGTNYFKSNKGSNSYLGANNTYALEAYSDDGGAAAMSFHRSGAYAVNMGLDPDNVIRIGGWSASANRLQLDMGGNLTLAGDVNAAGAVLAAGSGAAGGFKTTTYTVNSRNPIWRFGNADAFGFSYFQGTSGYGGTDSLGFHFGTATAAGSPINFDTSGNIYTKGDVSLLVSGKGVIFSSGNYIRNNTGSYGAVELSGTTNGYSGIRLTSSGDTTMGMYDVNGNGGEYDTTTGWHTYYNRGQTCLGIGGSSTSSGYKAYINGALYASGDITAFSDRRAKTDIELIPDALNKVLKLNGVTFTWALGAQEGVRSTGVIAQEVEAVLPEAVKTNDDGFKGVNYGSMVGILIEAIKELNAKVASLEAKLAEKS